MKTNTTNRNIYFLVGGLFSLAFAVFQISAVFWSPSLLIYFGGPVKMQAENPHIYIITCVLVGAMIAVAGFYALSGAGRFRPLPLLKTGLIAITAVYILRGLTIIYNIMMIQAHPEMNQTRFAVFSLIALCIGLIHLMGILRLFRRGLSESP